MTDSPPSTVTKPASLAAVKLTIKDVARSANVSASTVSNWLNGRFDQMRPETNERIRRAVEELGYAPNAVARQLKTGRTPIVGLIVASVSNPFWGTFAHRVERAAMQYGYQVLLCNSERDPERERRYVETLRASGIRGLIYGSSSLSFDHLQDLISTEGGMKVVAFDREKQIDDAVTLDSVGVDNRLGGLLATRHLLTLGHRRIAFVSGAIQTVSRRDRLAGYRWALTEAGIPLDPSLVWEGMSHDTGFGDVEAFELGRRSVHELFQGDHPPTALFAINDVFALGAFAGARDLRLRVPEDIAIVGFDDIPFAEISQPGLTTVRQPLQELMDLALGILVRRLDADEALPPEHVRRAPQLIVRESTAPPAA